MFSEYMEFDRNADIEMQPLYFGQKEVQKFICLSMKYP